MDHSVRLLRTGLGVVGLGCVLGFGGCGGTTTDYPGLTIHWNTTTVTTNTTTTLQVVVQPSSQLGQPLGIASYQAVSELGADYVRYVPWLPYPKLAVAELQPPTSAATSWDFSLIDPMTKDFRTPPQGILW